ncbi:MAG: hypothetical protein LBD87_03575 [Prevotellaceae bacterium]|jgi:uncharacterized membrane protein|nr:hypothetical protein [Prevotellaceae bacterium]
MDKASWSRETKKIFNGILLFSLAWIVYGILSPIESLFSGIGTLASFSDTPDPMGGAGTTLSIIVYLLLAGIGVGYILTIVGLGKFRTILEAADGKAIGSVRTAFILALVAVVLDYLPFIPGIIGGIVYLIAVILLLVGYGKLKDSSTFPGSKGATVLFIAMILIIVGWVLDFIPLVGDWLDAVLTIIAYIMTLSGWNKIKNAAV